MQTVVVAATPTVTVNPNPATVCTGSSTNLSASGATTYTWSPSTNLTCTNCATTTASPTANITYTVIGSTGGCNDTVTVPVTVAASIIAGATATSSVVCAGSSTTLTGSGGTTYTWTADPSLSCTSCQSPVATPTVNTTYTVTVASGSCPTATATIAITVTTAVVATATTSVNSICSGSSANLTAGGGGTYSWSPGGSLSCTTCANPVASPTTNTTYTVTVTNGACPTATAVVTLSVSPAVVATATSNSVTICNGQSANLTGGGGTTYSWSPAASLSCSNCANPVATPTINTIYTVTVSNGTVCPSGTATISITVTACSLPVASFSVPPGNYCNGDCVTLTSTSTGNPTSYAWSFVGPNVGSPGTSSSSAQSFCFSSVGTYSVQLIVSNGSGSDTIIQTIVVSAPPVASVSPSVDSVVIGTGSVLSATSDPTFSYNWNPSSNLSCANCSTTTATPLSSTWYYCTITNASGCSTIDSAFIYVDVICGDVFVANAFSPNGDHTNDVIHVNGNCILRMEWIIYDRWGEKVFESDNPANGWDGTFRTKPMDAAVFFYYLKVTTVDNKTKELKGNITLIR
jgi:gliding motility-associated-like protein